MDYFWKLRKSGFVNNTEFRNTVKTFFIDNDFLTDNNIAINIKDGFVTGKEKLANLFNSYYINIVENTTAISPVIQRNLENKNENDITVKAIIRPYKNQVSIINIKNTAKNLSVTFCIPNAKTDEVNRIIKYFNLKKATRSDTIPFKIVKPVPVTIDCHLTNI